MKQKRSSKNMLKSQKQLPAAVAGYDDCLHRLKTRIRSAQTKAAVSVNKELILLYWEVGKEIIQRQEKEGWGKSVVERLSADLQREFPDMRGFSTRNIWDMRRFYERYSSRPDLRQLVAEIPWGHNLLILNSLQEMEVAEWYMQQTVQNGWSRAILAHQIRTVFQSEHLV